MHNEIFKNACSTKGSEVKAFSASAKIDFDNVLATRKMKMRLADGR